MVDITIISTALSSLKAATDIAKFLRESDISLEKADLKLKLAELVSALADAKIQLVEIQETLQDKEKQIAELEEAFQTKDILIRHRDAYYSVSASGHATGVPYCLRCWENDHKMRQLVYEAGNRFKKVCTTCSHKYEARLVDTIRETGGSA